MALTAQAAYAALARSGVDATRQAGRYGVQTAAEALIPADIAPKLALAPHHRLLEIGCGPGALLAGLAPMVASTTGLDHADVIATAGPMPANVTLRAGGFPDADVGDGWDRVLVYSVLHCLPDVAAAAAFAHAAARRLAPGGRLLIGDLPNRDRAARFKASDAGRAFEADWAARRAAAGPEPEAVSVLAQADQIGGFTDAQLSDLQTAFRSDGFDAWILPQDPDLPFGRTREDLLVVRP
jgi:cyclopropane fatty-acyl-phospholipid synthase-like methyltransferase